MTPLDFFKQKLMPEEPIERIRPLLGRYGCSGPQQSQVMSQLSAGQKARIVFAIIAHEKPHLLLLDEPTNPLVSICWDLHAFVLERPFFSLLLLLLFYNIIIMMFFFQDMDAIDALARCLNKFKGGVLMISHDMRLISQCAEEIYICDHKKVTKYTGDIMKFKMKTRKENSKKLEQHMNG
jgi:ATP-binding cassette, subfamily F, member 2